MKSRLTVKTAAELLGISQQTLRIGMQAGAFPFAFAVKNKSKWCYVISATKFEECTGIRVPEGATV